MEVKAKIDEAHRKELLKFLLVKTAPVRYGVKPAELLRVRHCYSDTNEEGFRFCLYRRDIYEILSLDYIELKVESESSLVLFYNREVLSRTLSGRAVSGWLRRCGYPEGAVQARLSELRKRCEGKEFPHEIGVFIGYPLKDVVGFMQRLPMTPLHNGPWRVYGNAMESIRRMRLYAAAERFAGDTLEKAADVTEFCAIREFVQTENSIQLQGA